MYKLKNLIYLKDPFHKGSQWKVTGKFERLSVSTQETDKGIDKINPLRGYTPL